MNRKTYNKILTKEFLIKHYIEFKKSALDICNEFNIKSCTSIFRRLKKFSIPRNPESYYSFKKQINRKGIEEIPGWYLCMFRHHAKIRNFKILITKQFLWKLFLKQNKKCAISGVDLKFSLQKNKNEQTASLDRIDSNKDYTENNVQWIHKSLNKMKWDFDQDVFLQWINIIYNFQKGKK